MVPQLVTSPQIPFRPYECRQRERERARHGDRERVGGEGTEKGERGDKRGGEEKTDRLGVVHGKGRK